MKATIHPAVFLSGAIVFCALWLTFRPEAPLIPTVSAPSRVAQVAPPTISLDASILERYAGHYEGRADFTVELSLKDGRLYAQSPGVMVPMEMLATSEIEFFLKGSPEILLKFRLDSRGAVLGFDASTPYGPLTLDRAR
jgi:hypothetical protein